MARTPLLRAFTRLAEEHRAAEQLGIPPAELRGAAVSRREFRKRAGVVGGERGRETCQPRKATSRPNQHANVPAPRRKQACNVTAYEACCTRYKSDSVWRRLVGGPMRLHC